MVETLAAPLLRVGLCILFITMVGCSSSLTGWQVRTNSTPMVQSFEPAVLQEQPLGLFGAITLSSHQGDEVALSHYLGQIIERMAPNWKVVSQQEVTKRINREGLAGEYTRMRADFLVSNILDSNSLRKIASAIGVRYVFQPRLAALSQTVSDRWKFPPFDLRISYTRSSIMRIILQLWDTETGEVLWGSVAEATMQHEAISHDPVYVEDITRVTFGSMLTDFMNRRTASIYTPVDTVLHSLIAEPIHQEKGDSESLEKKSSPQPSK